jgi:hypothetical protein
MISSPHSANRCHMCTQLQSPNRAAAADSSFDALQLSLVVRSQ